MTKQRVLLIGATGNTGKSILNGLLEYGKYVGVPFSSNHGYPFERVPLLFRRLTHSPTGR